MTNKKPNCIITFSKEKETPEEEKRLLSEFFYTLYKWYEADERKAKIC